MTVVINGTPPVVKDDYFYADFSDDRKYPEQVHKYMPLSLGKAYRPMYDTGGKEAVWILRAMMEFIKPGYKHIYVDYKVRKLKEGDCGCPLEDWHMDVVKNPNHETKPDNHLIFSTDYGTEFMMNPIETDVDDFSKLTLPKNPNIWVAPLHSIVEYNRFNLHRGPIVTKPCKRVVIRLTQTDVF